MLLSHCSSLCCFVLLLLCYSSHCHPSHIVPPHTLSLFTLQLFTLLLLCCSSSSVVVPLTLLIFSCCYSHPIAPLTMSFPSHCFFHTIAILAFQVPTSPTSIVLLALPLLSLLCYYSSHVATLFCVVSMVLPVPLPCVGWSFNFNSSTKGTFFCIFSNFLNYVFGCCFVFCCFRSIFAFLVVTLLFLLLFFLLVLHLHFC
jgi:hypothetical protein